MSRRRETVVRLGREWSMLQCCSVVPALATAVLQWRVEGGSAPLQLPDTSGLEKLASELQSGAMHSVAREW